MKKIHYLFILFLGLLLVQCQPQGDRVIERPMTGLRNTKTLEIDKIELTDSATILYVDAYFYPNNWIRIDSATYIVAKGEKYLITGSEDIVLHAEHWMPESGEDHFKLFFPPIPKSTKSIDFIESDCDNCFKIWDIDLTGKATAYKPNLPKDILTYTLNKSAVLEEPEFKIAETKVTLFITGTREGHVISPSLIVTNIFTREQTEIEPKNEGNGKYVFDLELYSTASTYLIIGSSFQTMLIAPGEQAEVYFDATAYALKKDSRYHSQPDMVYCGYKGRYADLNNELLGGGDKLRTFNVNVQEDSSLLDKDAEGFVKSLLQQYQAKLKMIDEADASEAFKQLARGDLKGSLVNPILNMPRVYESLYRQKNKMSWDQPVDIKAPSATDKELLLLKEIQPNDMFWIYSGSFPYTAPTLALAMSSDEALNELAGTKQSLLQDLRKSSAAMAKATSREKLADNVEKDLNSTSTPHYAQVFQRIAEKTKLQYEEAFAQGGFTIIPTPEVDAEKILDAIVAEYKGKALFVDFWATWCGPCLNAMKTIKPFKPEMAEKGVVSLYISNASSPYAKWVSMLPDIGGIHYYLDDAQWRKLSDKYNIKGIPTYMIFDKQGNKIFETAGYPGNEKIKQELEKVW